MNPSEPVTAVVVMLDVNLSGWVGVGGEREF